jgi:hypothetical protein
MKDKTYKEVLKNLDTYRRINRSDSIAVTKEQKEFLLACRDHECPISYEKIAMLWVDIGWKPISRQQIKMRYDFIKSGKL